MKTAIKILSLATFFAFIFSSCNPNEVPTRPTQKYFIDSIQVYAQIPESDEMLIEAFTKNDSAKYTFTQEGDLKTFNLYDRSLLYSPFIGLLNLFEKNKLLNRITYYQNIGEGMSEFYYDTMLVDRNSAGNITKFRYLYKSENYAEFDEEGNPISYYASADKDFTYNPNSTINKINPNNILGNILGFNLEYEQVNTSFQFNYNVNIANQHNLIGLNINDLILCFALDKNVEFDYNTVIGIQEFLFSTNTKIENTPNALLPNSIIKTNNTYPDEPIINTLNLTYNTNPNKDNRIEEFTIGTFKYKIFYKP